MNDSKRIAAIRIMQDISMCLEREVGRDRELIIDVNAKTMKAYKLSGLGPSGVFSRCKGVNENFFVEDGEVRVIFIANGHEKLIYFVRGIAAMKAAVSAGITKAKD